MLADFAQIGGTAIDDGAGNEGSSHVDPPEAATGGETRAYFMTSDGGVLTEIPCDEQAGIMTIGRSKTAEIRINDPYVHRLQAEIRWDESARAHVLAHGGGENGTYVNRQRVQQPNRLQGGERIRFGKTELIYRIRR